MELKIEKVLKSRQIDYRLIKLSQNAYTVDDVVKYSGVDINQYEICKTIILRGKKSGKKIAVLLKGDDKVDFSGVKKLFGEEMTVANAEQVKEVAGVEPGAVCPFFLNVTLFVDKEVLTLEKIHCGSGDHLYGLEFEPKYLAKAIDYKVVDIVKESL